MSYLQWLKLKTANDSGISEFLEYIENNLSENYTLAQFMNIVKSSGQFNPLWIVFAATYRLYTLQVGHNDPEMIKYIDNE